MTGIPPFLPSRPKAGAQPAGFPADFPVGDADVKEAFTRRHAECQTATQTCRRRPRTSRAVRRSSGRLWDRSVGARGPGRAAGGERRGDGERRALGGQQQPEQRRPRALVVGCRGLQLASYGSAGQGAKALRHAYRAHGRGRSAGRLMLVARPGGGRGTADAVQNAWEPPEAAFKRQVRARTLYQHSTRFDGPTRKRVERIGGAGGEVRTLGDPFEQMVIFDRELAFIPADSDRDVAVAIRQPGVVDFLLGVFERAWVNARPFESHNRVADVSELVSGIRMSIIQLLAEGETDEAIARRVGLSVRTCRTHVDKIYQELGARSRCQLGVLIAQSGLLGQG